MIWPLGGFNLHSALENSLNPKEEISSNIYIGQMQYVKLVYIENNLKSGLLFRD